MLFSPHCWPCSLQGYPLTDQWSALFWVKLHFWWTQGSMVQTRFPILLEELHCSLHHLESIQCWRRGCELDQKHLEKSCVMKIFFSRDERCPSREGGKRLSQARVGLYYCINLHCACPLYYRAGVRTVLWIQTPNGLPNISPYPLHQTVLNILTNPVGHQYDVSSLALLYICIASIRTAKNKMRIF